jgi:hypothetical protein
MSKMIAALVLGISLVAAAPARAAWWVQGIQGASCATDSRTNANYEYRNRRLLNTSTDPWSIVVAACPISVYAPEHEFKEYRIYMTDPEARDSWCHVYNINGTYVRTHWLTGPGTDYAAGSLGSTTYPLAEFTVNCLVQSGASIDRLEIVWYKP